jgi:hypothetical protein
MLFKSSFS